VYSREAVGGQPDRCDWFAVAPEILFDTLRQIDPASEGRQGRPFASGFVATTAPVYLRQRRLVNSLMRGRVTPLEVEEETIGILGSLLKAQVPALARQPGDPARGKVEAAKELIAERFHETLSLRQIAAATETSVYHLCRIFRQSTGFTIHEYRDQLRLRSSLEAVATADDLLAIAVDLNYSSHSHFTARFRRAFGVPPSVVRANS
jgi:AraC-like DNA-binding protein